MKVTAKLTFGNIFAATLRLYLVRASTWWSVIGLFLFFSLLNLTDPKARASLSLFVAYCIVTGGFVSVMLLFAVFALAPFLTARRYMNLPGNDGLHEFETSERGFSERTSAREALTAWHAIPRVSRTKRFILIYLASWMFYVIPRDAFADADSYNAFFEEIESRISAASRS